MKVRSDIMKLAKNMHTWVGVCAGILLFICSLLVGSACFSTILVSGLRQHSKYYRKSHPINIMNSFKSTDCLSCCAKELHTKFIVQ